MSVPSDFPRPKAEDLRPLAVELAEAPARPATLKRLRQLFEFGLEIVAEESALNAKRARLAEAERTPIPTSSPPPKRPRGLSPAELARWDLDQLEAANAEAAFQAAMIAARPNG